MLIRFPRSMTSSGHPAHDFAMIARQQEQLAGVRDEALAQALNQLRDRLYDGEKEIDLANETFALVREAARRCLTIEHRPNQLESARRLLHRQIVELPTGEGKTLAATPALTLRALAGRGVWLATANDYLARRDALAMQSLFELLGLSTGYLQSDQTADERHRAYNCDITYGTIREFGFDFLRDRLATRRRDHQSSSKCEPVLQRERFSLIVDEADSILLDDARTPLIISEPQDPHLTETIYRWSTRVGQQLIADKDYLSDSAATQAWLTESGRAKIRGLVESEVLSRVTLPEAYVSVARAIEAERTFHRNRDYVLRDGKVVIVDRLNGRLAEGRQWQNGIQQAIEAAEGLELTAETNAVAKVTIQAFLREFEHLSGMTGTALEAATEFRRIYGLSIAVVPPFKPCARTEFPVQIHDTHEQKRQAVLASIREMQSICRPVLIGTRDLHATEELSNVLTDAGIEHQVLTAKQEATEAELISQAGQASAVTVSTSIAGRGTDIRLGEGVAEIGGLHVIAADLYDSVRVDRQLAGRGARQGDPATYQKILSLEDDILVAAYGHESAVRRRKSLTRASDSTKLRWLEEAQRRIEKQHIAARSELLNSERERTRRLREMGMDPYLDDVQ